MNHQPTLGFIGAGNMTRCLINGLISNHYPNDHIWASNPSSEKLDFLKHQFAIQTSINNKEVVKHSNILILAVKPQNIPLVINELSELIKERQPLVISIAAGITETKLRSLIGTEVAIVRCMPNIPAFVSSGATGMYANNYVSHLQRDLAETLFRSVGITLWVQDESQMDVIGALSGAGPAYFFFMMEALENAAVDLGLNREDAHLLTLQTAFGAARLALSTSEPIAELRERVTSKAGITEKALEVFESQHTRDIFAKAVKAAFEQSKELAQS